jgi:hypothetical protein
VAGYSCDEPLSVPALLVVGDLPDSHIASWQAVLPPDTVITRLAGGHFDLLRPPLVVAVASLSRSRGARRRAQADEGVTAAGRYRRPPDPRWWRPSS